MSFNGSGTFQINSSGQPVVTGTTISSTVFNALTADLATGLTTCITKDGQTTPTANLPMGNFKLTSLAAGTALTDSLNLGQAQNAAFATLSSVSGTDTITASITPSITSYVNGQRFSFIPANTNTAAATINISGLGAQAIKKNGTTALSAGDLVADKKALIEYDGTNFQLYNPSGSSATVSSVTGNGTVNGISLSGTVTSSGNITLGGTLSNVSLTSQVTGILPADNGGTGIAFVKFAGPATSVKTYTGPNANCTILTDNAAVTVAQGGTGQTSYTNGQLLIGNTTGNTLAKSTLTAGSGIAITNGSGSITIAQDFYSGSTASNVDYPVGSYVIVNTSVTYANNSSQDVRNKAGNAEFAIGSGTALTGTWRARGSFFSSVLVGCTTFSVGYALFQRTA